MYFAAGQSVVEIQICSTHTINVRVRGRGGIHPWITATHVLKKKKKKQPKMDDVAKELLDRPS